MRIAFLIHVLLLYAGCAFAQAGAVPSFPIPNERQLAWQQAELGVVFHYDLHVFDGEKYGQGDNRIRPMPDYNIFNPTNLDTDQWIRAAKAAGAKFAILTATHETGFALYQSDVNPYCLKAVKWQDGKGDIVRDFVNSCRKYGIKPGLYVGIRWNSFFGVHNFKVNGEGPFRDNRQAYYNQMVEGMVTELCTRYGELFEIWFDGGADHPDRGAPDVLPIVQKYQPKCLFYHNGQLAEVRWGGSESGTVPYPCWATFPYPSGDQVRFKDIPDNNFQLLKNGDPDGAYWMPAMSDAPLRGYNGRHEWFWEPGDDEHVFPVENLVDMYYKSVGRNSTLILGLTPDTAGLMPQVDVRRLEEFGAEINRRFARPLAQTSGEGDTLELELPEKQTINQLILQEDIRRGERVRAYRVEARVKGRWREIARGQVIGHKRIQEFPPVETNRLRLTVAESVAEPLIRNFSVYQVRKNTDDLDLGARIQPLPESGVFRDPDYYNWGGSILKGADGKYHLFYARWHRKHKFTGWLTHSEIAHAVADNPVGPYRYVGTALQGRGHGHWDAITAHNPKIKYFDGKYYLYYIGTHTGEKELSKAELTETARTGYSHDNWPILRNNQRTGVAVAESLDGPWRRLGQPIVEPAGPITTLTVNPAVVQGPDDTYYLIVKGDKPNETRFIRNQAMAIASTPTGPFEVQPNPVIDYLDTEDASMWYDEERQRFYAVFHAHTFIGLITSEDGRHWQKARHFEIMPKKVQLADGTWLEPDRMERPFVYVENGKPKALCLSVKKGDYSWNIRIPLSGDG